MAVKDFSNTHSPQKESEIKRDLLWTPFLFLFLRDIRRIYKVKIQTIVIPLVNSSLYLVIFGVSLGQVVNIHPEFSFLHFLIPGLVTLGVVVQSFQNGSSSLFGMKFSGEIIDIKSTALNFHQVVLALSLSGLLRGCAVGLLNLCLGQVFFFFYEGSWMPIHNPLFLVLFIVSSGFSFAAVGLFNGMWAKNFDQIGAVSGLILTPLMYLGGLFFDLEKLSPFWQKASLFNPLFYFVNGMRYSVLGQSDVEPLKCLAIAGMTVIFAYGLASYSVYRGAFQRVA